MTEIEFSGKAQAEDGSSELPSEPILRIETGQHGAMINRIGTDAANRFVVTASDDKTVRIWSLPEAPDGGAAPSHRPREYRQSLCGCDISGRDRRRGRRLDLTCGVHRKHLPVRSHFR
jgi:WD40 repeat protein